MSKQKYNIEHKNYAMKVMEWFYSIETDFDPDKDEVGESNYSIVVNTAISIIFSCTSNAH